MPRRSLLAIVKDAQQGVTAIDEEPDRMSWHATAPVPRRRLWISPSQHRRAVQVAHQHQCIAAIVHARGRDHSGIGAARVDGLRRIGGTRARTTHELDPSPAASPRRSSRTEAKALQHII